MDKYTNMPHGRFYRAYDALTEAYMSDRLEPQNSCCCFVGNLVAKACNYSFDECGYWNESSPMWDLAEGSYAMRSGLFTPVPPSRYMHQIDPTQYSIDEILNMERIFMDASEDRDNDFNAVVKTFEYLYSLEDWSDTERVEAQTKLEAFKELQKL